MGVLFTKKKEKGFKKSLIISKSAYISWAAQPSRLDLFAKSDYSENQSI